MALTVAGRTRQAGVRHGLDLPVDCADRARSGMMSVRSRAAGMSRARVKVVGVRRRTAVAVGSSLFVGVAVAALALWGSGHEILPSAVTSTHGPVAAGNADLIPPPTPSARDVRAVLTAIDRMDGHGPYRVTVRVAGKTSYLEMDPPSRRHYYVTKNRTVGEEISVDGAVWVRGPDGKWKPTDGMTHVPPSLTVADVERAKELAGGQENGKPFRAFDVTRTSASGSGRTLVTIWTDSGSIRSLSVTGADGVKTDYSYQYTTVTITPPA